MAIRFVITLCLALITPSLAWACSGLIQVMPLDFVFFGIAAGVAYRLFCQGSLNFSRNFHSAVYASFLISSFGAGVLIKGELTLFPGFFSIFTVVLAILGGFYPRDLVLRVYLFVPVLVLSLLGAALVFETQTPVNHEFHIASQNDEF